jgi:uncharacterized membrane protein HdeD (DUF308 family)
METQTARAEALRLWWVFLLTGVFWLFVSLVVLRFNDTSITAVGTIMGVVLLVGGLTEVLLVGAEQGTGWRILHGIVGLVYLLAAIWAFTQPQQAFWALASVLGFLLIIVGTVDILQAVVTRGVNPLWWLGLVTGILYVALAFWTSQQLVPVKGQLVLFYVGLFALFKGVSQIAFAFRLHGARNELSTP